MNSTATRKTTAEPLFKTGSLVVLKVDPRNRGKVLQVTRNGKLALVKFEKHSRPTLHGVEGLVLISPSTQLPLLHDLER